MNIAAISGRLVKNAIIKGTDRKVLLFTIASTYTNGDGEGNRSNHIPCVVFAPSEDLMRALTHNGEGVYIELEGRITTSSYESKGERKFTTEVVAFNRSITILKN